MSGEIVVNDKLVQIAVLETDIQRVTNMKENMIICKQMCLYAKQDGLDIINKGNPQLCPNTCGYYFPDSAHDTGKSNRTNN